MRRVPETLRAVPGLNAPDPTSFDEFWPYYVSQHLHPRTRDVHVWGPALAAVVGITGLATSRWWALPLAVAIGYGLAWLSHFLIEHNRPASFGHPVWSFRGDMRLIRRYLTGELETDVQTVRRAVGLTDDQLTLADAAWASGSVSG